MYGQQKHDISILSSINIVVETRVPLIPSSCEEEWVAFWGAGSKALIVVAVVIVVVVAAAGAAKAAMGMKLTRL